MSACRFHPAGRPSWGWRFRTPGRRTGSAAASLALSGRSPGCGAAGTGARGSRARRGFGRGVVPSRRVRAPVRLL